MGPGQPRRAQPLYASVHHVLPPDTVQGWIAQIEADIAPDWARHEAAAFAMAQIAQATGDRARDLPEEVRMHVAGKLEATHAAPGWVAMVREVTVLDEADQRRVFGEACRRGWCWCAVDLELELLTHRLIPSQSRYAWRPHGKKPRQQRTVAATTTPHPGLRAISQRRSA